MADARLYRTATGAALVIGPALFFLDNLLHPKELGRGNEGEQLALIATTPARWQIAHLLGFIGLIGICAAVLGLAWVVRRSQPSPMGQGSPGWSGWSGSPSPSPSTATPGACSARSPGA